MAKVTSGRGPLSIEGVVTRSKDKSGVHGVKIEGWVRQRKQELLVGATLSGADGTYFMPVDSKFADQVVNLRLIDRDGDCIYTAPRGKRLASGKALRADIKLDVDQLKGHDSRPTSFGVEALDFHNRAEVEGDIDEAISLFAPRDTPVFANMARTAYCPGPPFELFEDLLRLAPEVLRGDVVAAGQFQEGLDVLIATGAVEHGAEIISSDRSRPRPQSAALPPPFVSRDRAVPIMAAASLIGGSPGLGAILGTLCDFERIGRMRGHALASIGSPNGATMMRGILGPLGGEWGPDDGPPLNFPPDCPPPVEDHRGCLGEIQASLETPPQYHITSIDPDLACTGDLVTIRGTGFGSRAGLVRFRDGLNHIKVAPDTWSDNEITVRVPPNATCDLDLEIVWKTLTVCGRFVTLYYRALIDAEFLGSEPRLLQFDVNFRRPIAITCVEPEGDIAVRWESCGATEIRAEIVDETGRVLAELESTEPSGRLNMTAPGGNRTRKLTARVVATGPCGRTEEDAEVWVMHEPSLSVSGIEVNQSMQFFRDNQHLTDPNDFGPDNSIQHIVGKTAIARVYVRSGQRLDWDSGELRGVTGTLLVEQWNGAEFRPVATLTPINGPITADANPAYIPERRSLGSTLNFALTPAIMTGRLRLTATVSSSEAPCGGGTATGGATTIDVDLAQRLRLAVIRIGYNGPNAAGAAITANAPTMPAVRQTAAQTIAMFPVSDAATFRDLGAITLRTPLNDIPQPGQCSPNWIALMRTLRNMRVADGTRAGTIYYGAMATQIPVGPVIGCGGAGVGTGPVGAQGTMAHEAGHASGLMHSGSCGTANNDPAFPAFEPYDAPGAPTGIIGGFGIDTRGPTVPPPRTTDFMGNCAGWTSPYHYNRLMNLNLLNQATVTIPLAPLAQPRTENAMTDPAPYIDLYIQPDEAGEIAEVTLRRAHMRPSMEGPITGLVAELLDKNGKVVASASVRSITPEPCGCADQDHGHQSPPTAMEACIPDVARGAVIRVQKDGETVWQREAPPKPPSISLKDTTVRKNGNLHLSWEAEVHGEEKPDVWLRWSRAGESDWRAMAVELSGSSISIDRDSLPGGKVRFQLTVHDGFSCTSVESGVISLPEGEPTITIMTPSPDEPLAHGQPVRLWASINGAGGEPLTDEGEKAFWTLDGKDVGQGSSIYVPAPDPGNHEVTVTMGDTSAASSFTVLGDELK